MTSNEDLKIETKSIMTEPHPAMCWLNWDVKAAECKICFIADKCAESTKRNQSRVQVPAEQEAPKPVEPKSKPTPPKKAEEPKAETKPEAPKPEALKAEAPKTGPEPIVAAVFVESVRKALGDGFKADLVKEGEKATAYQVSDGSSVVQILVTKDGKFAKMVSSKSSQVLAAGHSAAELAKAVAAVR